MSSPNRPRRPHLDREEPNRVFTGVFGAKSAAETAPAGGPEADDVARGVGSGYRLIEEYLKRGQQVAEAMWPGNAGAAGVAMGGDRLLEYSTRVVGLWFDLVRNAWPTPPPSDESARPAGFEFVDEKPAPDEVPASGPELRRESARPRIALAIDSALPVEVSVDLNGDCLGKELDVFDLRAAKGDGPRVAGVTAAWLDGARLRVSMQIDAAQPPGTYIGVIVDAGANLPVGTITAHIRTR